MKGLDMSFEYIIEKDNTSKTLSKENENSLVKMISDDFKTFNDKRSTSLDKANTLIDENQQITALAYVATLKNLVAIIFQNVAGNILDVTTYSNLYLICFGWMLVALILVIFFKISSGNDKKLFN